MVKECFGCPKLADTGASEGSIKEERAHYPMVDHVQPDFLIIGAAKAATTWLQRCLQAQPSVFMPAPELHYFSREWHQGPEWFNAFFADAPEGVLLGEKSNSYFEDAEAMRRIKAHVPNAKLVLQLRNPIERAYSDYCMLYRRGEVDGRIEHHFDPKSQFGERFLKGGRYGDHLDHIDALFPADQLLVVIYDDMVNRPTEHLATLRDFLGLDALPPIETKVKDKHEAVVPQSIGRFLKSLKPVIAPYRNSAWFKTARGLIARKPSHPTLTPELHARLRDFYVKDIESLGGRIDRDLTPWLADTSRSNP
jgi:hypothetical protein